MELVEDLGAKVNKISEINEYINIFAVQVKFQTIRFIQMMSLTFGLFTQVSCSGPHGLLVSLYSVFFLVFKFLWCFPCPQILTF